MSKKLTESQLAEVERAMSDVPGWMKRQLVEAFIELDSDRREYPRGFFTELLHGAATTSKSRLIDLFLKLIPTPDADSAPLPTAEEAVKAKLAPLQIARE